MALRTMCGVVLKKEEMVCIAALSVTASGKEVAHFYRLSDYPDSCPLFPSLASYLALKKSLSLHRENNEGNCAFYNAPLIHRKVAPVRQIKVKCPLH
jgi:hypothetical protein